MFSPESEPTAEKIEDLEIDSEELASQAVAKSGNFYTIKNALEEENLLHGQIERVKSEYKEDLDRLEFLSNSDLEMFTIVELYDKNLAFHCIETFELAKSKAERTLAFDIVLIDVFASENVTPEQFYRACFLHDVGKVYVPNFILNNKVKVDEIAEKLDQNLNQSDTDTLANIARKTDSDITGKSPEEIKQLLEEHHLRPAHVLPVKYLLSADEITITENHYHLDINQSIMDIIETHEGHSADILHQAGYEIEADLAGAHHNYHGRGSNHKKTLEALHLAVYSVDTVELLRMADITRALGDNRSYKSSLSKPKIWKVILEETKAGNISPIMAYIWLDDEVKIFEQDQANIENLSVEDQENIEVVKAELERILSNLTPGDEFQFPIAA
ncbi:MAG: HD domain-containing protein [Candidatus Nomurabacteria bacterium]|nr:HD domain-containing protein [Candidatus Nomurabacteria bacterium]USN88042.1 MAG: HD domain-containing protein [Candidatus Nomurabacteria bacterium]